MFEPTCNTTPRTERRGTVLLSPRYLSCPLSACPRLYTAAKSAYKMRRCFPKCNTLAKSLGGRTLYAMPAWTTGGTDVICVEGTDDTGESGRKRETEDEGGERQREGEEEKRNEARLQG